MKGEADLRSEITCEGFSNSIVQRDSHLEQCWLISIATDELKANGKTVLIPMPRYGHRRMAGEFKQKGKHWSTLGRGDLEGRDFVCNLLYLLSFGVNNEWQTQSRASVLTSR